MFPGSLIARGAWFGLYVALTLGFADAAAVAAVSPSAARALAAPPVSAAPPVAPAQSSATSSTSAEEPMQEVVVSGEHEGPRMWKVHKPVPAGDSLADRSVRGPMGQGEHVLWILGTVTPLPKKMVW